jgi:TrmH family RNA methyltransferase
VDPASGPILKRIRRLASKRSERWGESACVLEGPDLVSAALAAGVSLEFLLVSTQPSNEVATLADHARAKGIRVASALPEAIDKVTSVETSQGVVAIAGFLHVALHDVPRVRPIVVLHDVRDPGNLGTAIRVADAAGASGVVLSGSCADLYNPKVVRATAGSLFNIPIAFADTLEAVRVWAAPSTLMATVVRDGVEYQDVSLDESPVVVFGNEASGLLQDDLRDDDLRLTIPMDGKAESLNVGVAAAVVLFEAARQRRHPLAGGDFTTMGGS